MSFLNAFNVFFFLSWSFQRIILWDFLEGNDHWLYALAAGVEDVVGFFSDSDDSDMSDYELFFD